MSLACYCECFLTCFSCLLAYSDSFNICNAHVCKIGVREVSVANTQFAKQKMDYE